MPKGFDEAALGATPLPANRVLSGKASRPRLVRPLSGTAPQGGDPGHALTGAQSKLPGELQFSRFCQLYYEWANALDPVLRQRYIAGEKLWVDYAGQTSATAKQKPVV